MRDIVKATAYVVILGTAISITVPGIPAILFWALVDPPIGACRNLTPSDCGFYMYVGVWAVATITVILAYVAFRVWNLLQVRDRPAAKTIEKLGWKEGIDITVETKRDRPILRPRST